MVADAPVPPVIPRRRPAWVGWAVAAGVMAVGAGVLYFFAPEQHGFYPRCWLFVWTGWQCPGCGGLRAMHELLHGHWVAAWQQNALLIVLLPVLVLWGAGEVARCATGREVFGFFRRPMWAWAVLAALVVFGLLRNVPWARLAGLSG